MSAEETLRCSLVCRMSEQLQRARAASLQTRSLLFEHQHLLDEKTRQELSAHTTTLEAFLDSQEQASSQQAAGIVLNVLVNAKETELLLWQATIAVEDRLTKAESEVQRVTALYKSSQQELAVRRVFYGINEKLLLRVAEKANVDAQQLYDERITNIGKVCRSSIPKYHKAWKEIQKEHGFSEEASEFWTDLKDCKEPFDKLVHEDSYDDVKQLSFVELQTSVAKEVFVGERAKFEPSFQFFLKVNKEMQVMQWG